MEIKKVKNYVEAIAPIPSAFWTLLEQRSKEATLEKGQLYAKSGDRVKYISFLLSGIIRIYHLDNQGNEWNKAFIEANAFLLSNINIEDKSQVYFEALTDCKILKVPITLFVESLKNYPALQKVYQYELGELFKRKSAREVSFMELTAKERYLKFKQSFPHLLNKIPQYHIASYLGITPTQLSRIKLSI